MRFTLERDNWYAMEIISPEFGADVRAYSPVKVYGVSPYGGGKRRFELEFFHANYPAGVQQKTYVVETIGRKKNYLLGRVIDSERIILIFALTEEWLDKHFSIPPGSDESISARMERYGNSSDGEMVKLEGPPPAFVEFLFKPHVLKLHGLPDIGYPVATNSLASIMPEEGKIDFRSLLFWLQEYAESSDADWVSLFPAMQRLTELATVHSAQETMVAQGDNFRVEAGPINLGKDIVTIQREGRLLAAFQPREDGTLRVAAYYPLDSKSIRYIIGLSQKPAPDGSVAMRPSNWEYALDCSAGMGNVYASDNGVPYLSRWEFGLGVSSDGSDVEPWIDQRGLEAIGTNHLVMQIAINVLLDTANLQ
jgi:hypothetical protein